MANSYDIFENMQDHRTIMDTYRNKNIDMSRFANVNGEARGDKVVYYDIAGVGVEIKNRTDNTDLCGNGDFNCADSSQAELTLDKLIDETTLLNNCRVNKLSSLSQEDANAIIGGAVTKRINSKLTGELQNHLEVVAGSSDDFTPTQTGVYEIIEEMVTTVEESNDFPTSTVERSTDIVVLVSAQISSLIRNQQLGCCEQLNATTDPTPNRWGVLDVIKVPASSMPAGVDILVYVKRWAPFEYMCETSSVFEGMSEKSRGYMVMQDFELFGSDLFDASDFPDTIAVPGVKYTVTAPASTNATKSSAKKEK